MTIKTLTLLVTLSIFLRLVPEGNGATPDSLLTFDTLTVTGNSSLSNCDELWNLPKGARLTENQLDEHIALFKSEYEKAAVRSCGFRVRRTVSLKDKSVQLFLDICEADFVVQIRFQGNLSIHSDTLTSTLYHQKGAHFFQDSIASDLKRIQALYHAKNQSVTVDIDVQGGREKRLLFLIKETVPKEAVITFEGATALKTAELQLLLSGKAVSPEERFNGLLSRYHALGFFDIAVRETVTTLNQRKILITEGEQRRCGPLHISGENHLPLDTLLFHAYWQLNTPFTGKALSRLQESLLSLYEKRGYPFTAVTVTAIPDSGGIASPSIKISEGSRYYLGTITLSGGEKCSPALLQRLHRLEVGSPFRTQDLQAAAVRLRASGLFEKVDSASVSLRSGYRILDATLPVKEGPRNSAEGALGYAPEEGKSGRISGLFRLDLRNLMGTGRSAFIRYKNEAALTEAEGSYKEPYLAGTFLGGEGSVNFESLDTLYTRLILKLSLSYPLSEKLRISSGFSRLEETQTGLDSLPRTRRVISTLFGLRVDTRNDLRNPTSGLEFDLTTEIGKSDGATQTSPRFHPRLALTLYRELWSSQVLAFKAAAEALFVDNEDSLFSDKPTIGGATTVRGYREKQFSGLSTGLVRLEYRFLLSAASRVHFFLDGGFCDPESPRFRSIEPQRDLLISAGFGLLIGTRAGQLGLEYGLSRGSLPQDGKIHLSLRNEF